MASEPRRKTPPPLSLTTRDPSSSLPGPLTGLSHPPPHDAVDLGSEAGAHGH